MHITLKQLRKSLRGHRVKANLIPGVVTTITSHDTKERITVKCVKLNKRTPTGKRSKVFRIISARKV